MFILLSGYAVYDAAVFYGPLLSEQNFPQGIMLAASEGFDHFLSEHDIEGQAWAIPVKDFQKSRGFCQGYKPETPTIASGAAIPFGQPILGNKKGNLPFLCRQEKVDKFKVSLSPESEVQILRQLRGDLALRLDVGSLEITSLSNAQLELLLPNGKLSLNSAGGFTATLLKQEDQIVFTVEEGEVQATPEIARNFREETLACTISAAGKARVSVAGLGAPLTAGKSARILPSGIYEAL